MCRNLKIREIGKDKALANHTIRTIQPISDIDRCKIECFLEWRCFSFNFCTKSDGRLACNLIDSDHIRSKRELVEKPGCTHYGSENACSSSPCPKNATCRGDFDDDPVPYRCVCPAGYTGPACNDDVDECKSGSHGCHKNATCENTEGGYNCTCDKGYHGDGKSCQDIDKCKSGGNACHVNATCIYNAIGGHQCVCHAGLYGNGTECRDPQTCEELNSTLTDTEKKRTFLHLLKPGGGEYSVFCSYSNLSCGLGTWKLALKINGSLKDFVYESKLWKEKKPFKPEASLTGLDESQTMTSAYWGTPLTKLCLGMKYGGVTRWIAIDIIATSLQSVISGKDEKLTNLGEAKWRSLLPAGITSLQTQCKKEGFNLDGGHRHRLKRNLRLGYFSDSSVECKSFAGLIGVGSRLERMLERRKGFTCGNFSPDKSSDNGAKNIPAFCYILVQ